MKSLKGKIISSAISIGAIVTLIAFGVSTSAWWNNNTNVKGSGIKISSDSNETVKAGSANIDVYTYDIDADKPLFYESSEDLSLTPYNAFVPQRHIYNAKYCNIKLTYPLGATSSNKLRIKIDCTGTLYQSDEKTIAKFISNLVEFKFFDNYSGKIRKIGEEGSTLNDVYADLNSTFNALTAYSFVTIGNDTISKAENNIITIDLSLPSFAAGSFDETDFYFMINYDNNLIEYYKKKGDATFDLSFFSEGKTIDFVKDISVIDFSLI